jgi:hypothetical protein
MIRFETRLANKDDNRTPILYDREIDDFARAVLNDYNQDFLREPGKIDAEHFLEHYLDANVQFHDIYNDDPSQPIFALTAFTEGTVKVFDKDNECISEIFVPARTVVIDNEVMKPGKEGLSLFTFFHEGGHLMMHWDVFVDGDGLPHERTNGNAAIVSCRRENIEIASYSRKERTPMEWREHQADYFAAAIAMPNTTFCPLVVNFLRENGVYKNHIKMGADPDLDILAYDIIPEYISDTYGVSKRAARIKLRKGGFISGSVT